MMGHENYWKKNLAAAMVESEGWTKNLTDSVFSRRINPDEVLHSEDVVMFRKIYGSTVRMVRDVEPGQKIKG